MDIYQRHKLMAFLVLWSLSIFFYHPAEASELKDGQNYRAEEAVGAGGATMVFRRQGAEIVGIAYTAYFHACYHGSLAGNAIKVKEVVSQDEDLGTFSYEPLLESVRDRFVEISFTNLQPFPNPGAILPTPKRIVDRDVLSLNECARHFNGIAPPCNDPRLKEAMENDGEIKYFHPGTVCRRDESPNCTLAKVFEVLIASPSAIAPIKDGPLQRVENCGILKLKAFSGILKLNQRATNEIKTVIDRERYTVTNYTLPGHAFYPGRVVRWLVEVDGRIDINTQGLGKEDAVREIINIAAASHIWEEANRELDSAVCAKLKICKARQLPIK